jgi:hypothetical protein
MGVARDDVIDVTRDLTVELMRDPVDDGTDDVYISVTQFNHDPDGYGDDVSILMDLGVARKVAEAILALLDRVDS